MSPFQSPWLLPLNLVLLPLAVVVLAAYAVHERWAPQSASRR